jgi:copper homeostasis protein (lipoprotein)
MYLTVLLVVAALGCTSTSTGATLGGLPATFEGLQPCADCPGIDCQLNLFDDGVFYLRMAYRERGDAAFDDIGTWSIERDGTTLALSGSGEAPTLLRIVNSDTLRLLDRDGGDIESSLSYDLLRSEDFVAIEPRLMMRGMYSYFADAGLFTECRTGRSMLVATEGDNAALEGAYLKSRGEPGESLLVAFEGRIAMRPPMEGDGLRPTVVVEKFLDVLPDETCAAAPTARQR